MGAGWIAKGPDTASAPDQSAAADPWQPTAPDAPAQAASISRPHAKAGASPLDNTRSLFTKGKDFLFGHEPQSAQDQDQAHVPGVFPAIGASVDNSVQKVDDWMSSGPSAATLARSYPKLVGADFGKLKAGYQDLYGASQVQRAERDLAALNVLPQVAARLPGPNDAGKADAMADDPLVQKTARSLGISPQEFAHDYATMAGASNEDLADRAARAKQVFDQGKDNQVAAKGTRNQAWADERVWQPSDLENGKLDPWSLKGIAFNTALGVPKLAAMTAATVGGTALAGPGGGVAAGASTAMALFAPEQRQDAKDKIDDQVNRLLQKADQLDDAAPVGGKRGMNPVTEQLRAQAQDLASRSDHIADTAGFLYAVGDAAGALPVTAVLARTPGGQAVMNRIVGATLAKTMGGRIAGTMVANGAGGMLQESIQKAVDAGIVHENTTLADALKDIAYTGVVSAATAAPIGAAHEIAGAGAARTARRNLDSDELLAKVHAAADAMGRGGDDYPGFKYNQDTGRYEPTSAAGGAASNTARLGGGGSGGGARAAPPGAPPRSDGGDQVPSGQAAPAGAQSGPSPQAPAGAGGQRAAYQAKTDALNEAAAAAEKRSDVTLEPEEEGWSVHVKGQPVATFNTVEAARAAVAQARKLVGTKPASPETNPPSDATEAPISATEAPISATEAPSRETTPGKPTTLQEVPYAGESPRESRSTPVKTPVKTGEESGVPQRIPETPLERTQPVQSERRSAGDLRQRVADMSPEQMKAALLTHDLTGIPNKRAFDETPKKPAVASLDVDSLGWVNNFGHEAGDQYLKTFAQALHEVGGDDAFHKSGDEFILQGDDHAHLEDMIGRVRDRLAGAQLTFEHPDGRVLTLKGINFSHGAGDTYEQADSHLNAVKREREAEGLRAPKGSEPRGASVQTPEGGVSPHQGGAPARGQEGLPGSGSAGAGPARRPIEVLGQKVEPPHSPSAGQAKAGNYFKPTVQWHGLPIKLENAAGSKRGFKYPDGTQGTRTMRDHYGYFPAHEGADGDGVDVFVAKGAKKDQGHAYVIDQLDGVGKTFDEHKVVLGVDSAAAAKALYLGHYQNGWKGFGGITELDAGQLKRWLKEGNLQQPIDPESVPSQKVERGTAPDARHDSILEYLARHPRGLDSEEARAQGIDPADMRLAAAHVGIKRAFRRGGMSFDHAAETLAQDGYPVTDAAGRYSPNTLLDRIDDELRGTKHLSTRNEAHHPVETKDWRQPLSDRELARLTIADAQARLAKLQVEQDRLEREIERAGMAGDSDLESSQELERIPFQRREGATQGDLFGDKVAVRNEIKRVEAALDKKRNSGQESLETGRPDDLFSQARDQMEIPSAAERARPTTLYRGTETGVAGVKRVSHGGEIGSAIYATPHQWLARSYGGGPKAHVGAGRDVHRITLPKLPPEQYGYIEGGSKRGEKAKLVDYRGKVLHEYEGALTSGAAERAAIRGIAEKAGIKVIVGEDESIAHNQVAILDPDLISHETLPATGQTKPFLQRQFRPPAGWNDLFKDRPATMSQGDIRTATDKMLAGFSVKPDVVIAKDLAELQADPQIGESLAGAKDGEVVAFMHPSTGKIYLVGNQMRGPEEVAATLAHEYITHYGLRAAFGDRRSGEYQKILDGVARALPAEMRKRGEAEFPGSFNPLNAHHRNVAAEETLAYFGQRYAKDQSIPARAKRWLDRFLGMVRDWVRQVLGLPQKFDATFVKRTLGDLESYLRRGPRSGAGSDESLAAGTERPAFAGKEDTFFSGLAKAVDGAKREKGTGAEWEATLRNMPGVKAEELQWTGLKDWLEGRGRVSKAEVADFVHAHRVQVGEVMHGGMPQEALDDGEVFQIIERTEAAGHDLESWQVKTLQRGGPDTAHLLGELGRLGVQVDDMVTPGGADEARIHGELMDMGYRVRADDVTGQPYVVELHANSQALEIPDGDLPPVARDLLDKLRAGNLAPPKYPQYVTPGGKNYRELLMTLPELPSQKGPQGWGDTAGGTHDPMNFRGSHWAEPNVLAHVRFDERTGAGGERVLHIAEVQSDWHQVGRRQGYETPATRARAEEARGELKAIVDRMKAVEARGERDSGEWHSLAVDRANLRDEIKTWEAAVPNAPFKTTWPELAMKRMLRYAAERGYDALSWDTGDTSAERYDLSKHLSRLELYDNSSGGIGNPEMEGPLRRGNVEGFDLNGKPTLVRHVTSEKELADLIGKDAAEKLLAAEAQKKANAGINFRHRKIEGLDLKVGGEGMRAFYDKMLPAAVGKLVKKWGGTVEPVSLPTGDGGRASIEERGSQWVVTDQDGQQFSFHEERPAREFLRVESRLDTAGPKGGLQTHMVKITPAMRDAVLGGQPMFLKRRKGSTGEAPPPKKGGAYDLARRAIAAIPNNEFALSLRRIADPANINEASKATALVTREALGELAQNSEEALRNLEQYSKLFDVLSTEDRFAFIDAMEGGEAQADTSLQPAADAIRKLLDDWRERIRGLGTGALDNFIENYFPHIWQNDARAKKLFGQIFGRRPLKGPASFLKQRTIPTTREGLEAGLKPISTNPLILAFAKLREMQRFHTGVKLMQRFKEEGLAKFLPAGKLRPDDWAEINDAVGRVRQWSETEQGFIERGHYVMPIDAARVINNHLSASALRNFLPAQIFRALSNAANALQLGFSAFHLGFTTLDAMISKNALGIERLLHGEPLKAAASFLEGGTPIGAALNIRRGRQLLKAYTNPTGSTPQLERIVQGLMASGGRVKMDNYFQAAQGLSPFKGVGFAGLASDIRAALTKDSGKVGELVKVVGGFPQQYATRLWRDLIDMAQTMHWPFLTVPLEVAGRATRASTSIIMEHIVPWQKLGVFSDLAADHIRRNPVEDPVAFAGAMQKIWNSVDNRLGEMVYDNVFWQRTFKDVNHMMVRAVGWNLGTIRELGGAPVDVLKTLDYLARGAPPEIPGEPLGKTREARAAYEQAKGTFQRIAEKVGHKIPYTLALIGSTMVLGAILTRLFTGKGPEDIKDYFFPPTGRLTKYGTKERISMPSYTKDLYEYATQPATTVINKANPIFGIAHSIYANEDFFGNAVRAPDDPWYKQLWQGAKYAGHEVQPFSLQGTKQFVGAGAMDATGKTLSTLPYVGFGPAPARVTSPEQMDRYQRRETEKSYIRGIQRKLRAAQEKGDTAEVRSLQEELKQRKLTERATERDIRTDKVKAREAAKKIAALVEGRSREQAVAALHAAGMPAMAQLWDSMPDRPRPRVAQSLETFA